MRIKRSDTAVYHCINRVVAGEMLLEDGRGKEVLRRMLWRVADFCGVEIIAYALMSNHFHVLVRVPERRVVPDAELMRRYRVLYPDDVVKLMPEAAAVEAILAEGESEEAQFWRERLLSRMHDVSEFMKTLKQRFTAWYNRTHRRFGTFWAERFKSVLVEDSPQTLQVVAAYIDLNPIRAGLVADPGNYRWSSYGEAMGGGTAARHGLLSALGAVDGHGQPTQAWREAVADYRMVLFGKGAHGRIGEQATIAQERVRAVLSSGGKVTPAELLRCRVRYLSDGAVFGSEEFVRKVGAALLQPGQKPAAVRALGRLPSPELGHLASWRRLQVRAIG